MGHALYLTHSGASLPDHAEWEMYEQAVHDHWYDDFYGSLASYFWIATVSFHDKIFDIMSYR